MDSKISEVPSDYYPDTGKTESSIGSNVNTGEFTTGDYTGDTQQGMTINPFAEDDDNSPVEEVALTVSTADDPSLPSLTFRVWVLGLIICGVFSFVNQYFWFRTVSIVISPYAGLIMSLYVGRFMASTLPDTFIGIGDFGFTLNPGPFNIKEHVLITIFASAGSAFGNGNAYAIDIITIIKQYYKFNIGFFPSLLLILTTQITGYGIAGLFRRFLVEPAHMWWPANLVSVSLYRTLHEPDRPEHGMMSRVQFYFLIATISFCWYSVPLFLIPIVTCMSWVCWGWPHNFLAHQLGSGQFGLGVGSFAVDWGTIEAFLGSPLATPWFAILNVGVGFVLLVWVAIPIVYFNNLYDAQRFPILTSSLFQYSGERYNTTFVLTPELTLDVAAFEEAGHPFLAGSFTMTYAAGFASLTALITHVIVWHGREMVDRVNAAVAETKPDIHTRLMQRYPVLPEWWFIVLLIVNLGVAIAMVEGYKTFQLHWWGVLLAVAYSLFFVMPIGVITATTNLTPGLNIITEMTYGYMDPGRPIANVLFKTYGYISNVQAISFLSDFKLGHYMKVPPRNMFIVQVIGTMMAGAVNLGTAWWLYQTILDGEICVSPDPNTPWTCPSAAVFFSASVIWGLVGPSRMFAAGKYYANLNWAFLIGAVVPVVFWGLYQVFPDQLWLRRVNIPVLLTGIAILPPAGPINFVTWFIVGFVFNYLVFNFRKKWWMRYNYILSAGLDTGVVFMTLIAFFGTQLDFPFGDYISWWGAGVTLPDNCQLARCSRASGALSIDPWCPNFLTPNP